MVKCEFVLFLVTGPVMLKGCSWLCAQAVESLAVVQGPYGKLEIRPRLTVCKAGTLPAVLLLWPKF